MGALSGPVGGFVGQKRPNKSGNVARTFSLPEMCSKWPKTGRVRPNWLKRGQKVPRRPMGGKGGSKWGRGRAMKGKSHEWSLSPSLSVRKWYLVHPFRETVNKTACSKQVILLECSRMEYQGSDRESNLCWFLYPPWGIRPKNNALPVKLPSGACG